MMHRKQFIPLMLALAGVARAAELGDIAPRSYLGQPLAVDIELVSLTPEEALNLPVRLAQADVYRAANAAINPALASVRMQVDKRGARQVLHVTTTRAVEAEYLHLYVELGAPGKSEVRLATVWLQRDPNPPPAPVVAAVATPVAQPSPPASALTPAQAEQITAPARAARAAADAARTDAAKAESSKAELAKAEAAPVRDRSKPAPLPSLHEAETGKPGEIKAAGQARRIAGVLVGSDGKPVAPSAREEAAGVPVAVSQALLPLAPLPLPKSLKRPAPASCAPAGMSAKECVALDARNTEMASKITELEGKLKALQGALGGAAPATAAKPGAVATAASAAAAAAAAKPAAQAGAAAAKAESAPAPAMSAPAAPAGGAAQGGSHAAPGATADKTGVKTASAGAAATASGPAAGGEGGGKGEGHGQGKGGDKGGDKGASSALASASLSAQGETEAHAAKAAAASASASAAPGEASASAAASVPTKQVRVLPKLKYKKEKEKPAEQSGSAMLPLIGGAVGLLALLGGGFVFLRKRGAGKGPLKIWQGFRKKKTDQPAPDAAPSAESAPESVA